MGKQMLAYGYTKPDPDSAKWIAICVNMCLFAQGETYSVAMEKMSKAIDDYIAYIKESYPHDWEKYLYHPAPDEFMDEFREIVAELNLRASKPQIIGESITQQKPRIIFDIPSPYAEAGV